VTKQPPIPFLEDIFGRAPAIGGGPGSGRDLRHGKVDEFIADLYALRRSDVA
jgi:hypothetical protein